MLLTLIRTQKIVEDTMGEKIHHFNSISIKLFIQENQIIIIKFIRKVSEFFLFA